MMIVSFVIYGVSIKFPDGILLLHGVQEDLKYYHLPVTPTMVIFISVCVFQALWIVYSLLLIVTNGIKGTESLPYSVFMLCAFASQLNVIWLVELDNHAPVIAFAVQISVFASLLGALVIGYRNFEEAYPKMIQPRYVRRYWLIRLLVHNGLAFQTTWAFELALINMGLALTASSFMTQSDAALLSVSLLAVVMTLYTVAENIALNRWTLYTLSPYILHLMVCVAILVNRLSVSTAFLLSHATGLVLLKVVMIAYKYFKAQGVLSQSKNVKSDLETYAFPQQFAHGRL
ncbi:hypothetical protein RRG08_021739 [Elysia crispata]|uniref:Uncharacterized protein n=1 Tax=Elysia crispata TaxID=231223 RepID=A0AAE0ZXP8_9GAST|nr:hypothetical protein RRG08_021739 [Elysia crispata]